MDVSPPSPSPSPSPQFETELFSDYNNSTQIHGQVEKRRAEKPSRLISEKSSHDQGNKSL